MVFKLPKCSLDSGPSPFWLDWLGEGSISSGACFTATHSSWPESISQQFFSPLITPSQPARPIDLVRSANSKGLIWSEVVGTNRLLYRKKLYFGWTPIFNHYSWRRPALRYGRTRRRTQAAEMQKRRAKIPDPVIDSTTNLLNEGSLLTLSH